ncbi:transmembrane anterior posterior transformation protein 1 homolog isoform X1 [Tachypleus tridentatus]|uniref:transmembrane anterior posterior transformation protein 1 homolog isoform X1 n=2 Tax=Tachypleus tridentatus TaxID=6853 RepID=UPI003FD004F4
MAAEFNTVVSKETLDQDRFVENIDVDSSDKNVDMKNLELETPNQKLNEEDAGACLLDYLYNELRRGYVLENEKQRYMERREKFYIFMKIPREIEKFIFYGFFQCADAFLFIFTFLPLRFALSVWFLITRSLRLLVSSILHRKSSSPRLRVLQPAEICDFLKGIILILVSILMSYMDTSMLYHIVKSQSVIKLYIFFNMLEVADKLFSSFGQDILDALFWTATEPRDRKREHLGVIPHLGMAIGYVFTHTVLVLLQATTLNVAINSQNKALLTIMMSNNFVELKGMVFKKFEKKNLFLMSCSDVRERFHYLILLFIVIIQTMKEYNWRQDHFLVLFLDCVLVMLAEVVVDWLKHAFITRFNEISHEVYRDYTVSLAYDMAGSKLKNAYSDHSDIISRRMGFIPLPLGALVFRVVYGSVRAAGFLGKFCVALGFCCLLSLKILNNLALLGKACDMIDQHRQSQKEKMPPPRQYSSLPSSRHHSIQDIPSAVSRAKSMPQSPAPSTSSSMADISAQVKLVQESLDSGLLFSNSTVSLNSLGMNEVLLEKDGVEKHGAHGDVYGIRFRAGSTSSSILKSNKEAPKRHVSLQETGTVYFPNIDNVTRDTLCETDRGLSFLVNDNKPIHGHLKKAV